MRRQRRSETAALRALLVRQEEELSAEALRSGGLVPAARLDEASRLARLVEMRDTSQSPLRWRWLLPLVAAVTLAFLSVLLFVRVRTTEVELELKASEVTFVVLAAQVVTDPLTLSAIGLSGLRLIELPDRQPLIANPRPSDITLTTEAVGGRSGLVNLEPLAVSAGARVSVVKLPGLQRYGVVVQRADPDWGASVSGRLRSVIPGRLNELRDFPIPRHIGLEPDSARLSLRFTAADSLAVRRVFRSPIPAGSLRFVRIDRFAQSGQTFVPQVPTIQSGTLYYEAIDGRARPLRPGEGLYLTWSEGEIRDLRLDEDGVSLRFHGRVSGMSTGSSEARRSLMPTLLEWLRTRHGLELLWVSTAYAVGLFATVVGWWRRTA
jgi:hypothetical protein